MSDRRQHRGAHPRDAQLFSAEQLGRLREAAGDYGWLLDRGYASGAALTLVGNRFQLHKRQREALMRAVCGPRRAAERRQKRVPLSAASVVVDGFNVLVTMEAALAGAVLLRGSDGLLRDLANVHGTYRLVEETRPAIALLSEKLADAAEVLWLLDRPVSNSGRIAALLRAAGWRAELADTVDRDVAQSAWTAATSDGPVIDRAAGHVDLLGSLVAPLPQAWIVDFAAPE